MRKADIQTTWTEPFVIVWPASPDGECWLLDNLDYAVGPLDDGSFPVEHRYIADIIYGAKDDGLSVQDTATERFA